MIVGGHAILPVRDVERSVRFYVETLGFKVRRHDVGDFAVVDTGDGLVLGLARRNGTAATTASVAGAEPHPSGAEVGVALGLTVNIPISDAVAVLENRGVTFDDAPASTNANAAMTTSPPRFRDLDGHAFYLVDGAAFGGET